MESGQGMILARVVSETNRVMRGVQDQWTRIIEAEYRKTTVRPEETPGGLVEYVIALANDQIKSADYAEALPARLKRSSRKSTAQRSKSGLTTRLTGTSTSRRSARRR
jgi:BRCT domain type II-containing protein